MLYCLSVCALVQILSVAFQKLLIPLFVSCGPCWEFIASGIFPCVFLGIPSSIPEPTPAKPLHSSPHLSLQILLLGNSTKWNHRSCLCMWKESKTAEILYSILNSPSVYNSFYTFMRCWRPQMHCLYDYPHHLGLYEIIIVSDKCILNKLQLFHYLSIG